MAGSSEIRCLSLGDSALLVEFENRIGDDVLQQVLTLAQAFDVVDVAGVKEVVTGYRSLMIHYDPIITDESRLVDKVGELNYEAEAFPEAARHWEVPVLYGGKAARDLGRVAGRSGLDESEVIGLHVAAVYRVYMVGFAPGWTFLGGLDERLHTPRLETPRAEVPAGCISIGGQQTLVGGPSMPSGWNLIGRTPERTFAPHRQEPFFIAAGDWVSFRPIDESEFRDLEREAAEGERVSREICDG